MFWIIACIILLMIIWPYILPLLAQVGNFILFITSLPVLWTLKLIRRPKTKEEEEKLTKDTAKGATIHLGLLILVLLIWVVIKSINS